MLYIFGSLSIVGAYLANVSLSAKFNLEFRLHPLEGSTEKWAKISYKSLKGALIVGMCSNLISVGLMVGTVYQMNRLVNQINETRSASVTSESSSGTEQPTVRKVALREPVVTYHILMLVISSIMYGIASF